MSVCVCLFSGFLKFVLFLIIVIPIRYMLYGNGYSISVVSKFD